jgi:hypothetical protein
MIGWLRNRLDNFIGSGDAALVVPPMDGALKPNRLLDKSQVAIAIEAPDDLCVRDMELLVSSGNELITIGAEAGSPQASPCRSYPAPIAAIAARGDAVAVALANGEIGIEGGHHDGREVTIPVKGNAPSITAIDFVDADHLAVCIGSTQYTAAEWQSDLLLRGNTGSVWRVGLATGDAVCLASGLAFPYGLMPSFDGRSLIVSESWRHRLIKLDAAAPSTPEVVLVDLPGYPARLHDDGSGGAWLALFAPRNQLVEFVIREPEYRDRMMTTLRPAYWIAPALRSRGSFLEPLQGGGVRQMGMLKPWAPTRSYGLVIGLDGELEPRRSMHSRADGHRHGTTSCIVKDGRLVIASKGGNELLFHDLRGRQ